VPLDGLAQRACLGVLLGVFVAVRTHALETATQSQARLTGTAVTATNYMAGYLWEQSAPGTLYGPYAGLAFKQKLYASFMADLSLHAFATSASDNGVAFFLDRAEASWHGPWLTLAGGRREVGAYLSPSEYFGSYLTMGERTVDMASATLPFRIFADVPDADASVTAPYNAFSLVYVPNLLSAAKTTLNGYEGIVLGQLRVKFGVGGSSSDLILNYSRGLQETFLYSSLSEAGGLDGSYAFSYKFARLWGEYAIQDVAYPKSTSVQCVGLSLRIAAVTLGLFDSLEAELQLPLGDDPDNPFTGGDPQNPALAVDPQRAWFIHLVHYGLALTNSVGDYTLARLREGTLSQPVGPGYGAAPRIQFLPFVSSDYAVVSGLVDVGYEF
jgi:hypothetical protein